MKRSFFFAWAVFLGCWVGASGQAPVLTLKSMDGTSIEATPLHFAAGQLTVVRASDNRTFTFSLDLLDEPSRQLIQNWSVAYELGRSLGVSTRLVTLDRDRSGNVIKEENRESSIELTLKNRSQLELPPFKIQLNIFIERQQFGQTGSGRYKDEQIASELSAVATPPGAEMKLFSEPFSFSKTQLDGNWYWVNGAPNRARDRYKGVWLRVVHGGRIVQEISFPETLMQREHWKEPKKSGR